MKLSPDEFEETVGVARNYLQASSSEPLPIARLARNFAEAIVKLADGCVVGVRCERHYGAVHGQEAEELRAGIEQILRNTSDVDDDAAPDVLRALRKSLVFLLDRIDARDSLAFREVTDVDADGVDEVQFPEDSEEAYRARCAARRSFFASLSPGDKIAWGFDRSGTIQKIEDDHVTILHDGWPADLPLGIATPPFVVRLRIDYTLNPKLIEKADA